MKELPVISVNEARKLLGKEAQDMDDEQIIQVVQLLTDVAQAYLESNAKKLRKGQQ